MIKTLRIPDEYRFVRAFVLTLDPGDALALLMEIGALSSADLGIVRRTREALIPAYDQASNLKDWDQTHIISILREALALPDSAAYLACQVRGSGRAADAAAMYAEALVVVGCAADTLTLRRRPWEIEADDFSLPEWRKRVWKLLREAAMPGNFLPKPSTLQASINPSRTGHELVSPPALGGNRAAWHPVHSEEEEP